MTSVPIMAASTAALGAALLAASAHAQTPSPPSPSSAPLTMTTPPEQEGLGQIIVTAQRRSEDIQKAALAITALTGPQLQSKGITNTEELSKLTSALQVQPSTGPYTTFTIRSVTSLSGNAFSDPAVAVNSGGVYLATPTTIFGLFYDVDRVEVLKGPQGTLYGRNATAGAINIIPKRPGFALGADLGADVGNYGKFNVNGAINVPVSDTIALRVAGQRVKHEGYFSDGTSDEDGYAARGSILFDATPDLSLLLTGDYAHQGGKGPGGTIRRACSAPRRACFVADPFTGVQDLPDEYIRSGLAVQTRDTFNDSDFYGVAATLDWKTPLGAFTLIAADRWSDVRYVSTATSWQLREVQHPRQKSVEAHLASGGFGRLKYVLGAYYLDTTQHAIANGENGTRRNFSDQRTNLSGWTAAAFTQLTYSLTDQFRLTGGARYTHEKKSSDSARYVANTVGPDPVLPADPIGAPTAVVQGSRTWNKVSWKVGVEFDAAPRSLLYANVSTGFKAGGFYYGPPGSTTFEPEHVTAYVIGSKNRFLDNRLQINGEAFYLDYTNQQVSFVKLIGVSSTLVIENAGKVRTKGFELETDYLLTPTTHFYAQLQYLDADYKAFSYLSPSPLPATSLCRTTPSGTQFGIDCAGAPALRSPPWTVVAGLQQTLPLASGAKIIGEANLRYEDGFEGEVTFVPETRTYATARIDAALSFVSAGNRFALKAYVDNITNVTTILSTGVHNGYATTGIAVANLSPPRTYGLRASVSF